MPKSHPGALLGPVQKLLSLNGTGEWLCCCPHCRWWGGAAQSDLMGSRAGALLEPCSEETGPGSVSQVLLWSLTHIHLPLLLYLAWGWQMFTKVQEFQYFPAFAKSESSLWSLSFILHPLSLLWSLQRKMLCRISETHMYLHTNRQLSVGNVNKYPLTKCEEGMFGTCFVSSVPGSSFPAFEALQPLLDCDSHLPGVMGRSRLQTALAPQLLAVMFRVFPASSHKLLTRVEGQTTDRSDEKSTTDFHGKRFKAI